MLDLTYNFKKDTTTKRGLVVLKQEEVYDLLETLDKIETYVNLTKDWTEIANVEVENEETLAAQFTIKVIHDKLSLIDESLSKIIDTFK